MRLLTLAETLCLVASMAIAAPVYPREYLPQTSSMEAREEVPPDNWDFAKTLANADVRPTLGFQEPFPGGITNKCASALPDIPLDGSARREEGSVPAIRLGPHANGPVDFAASSTGPQPASCTIWSVPFQSSALGKRSADSQDNEEESEGTAKRPRTSVDTPESQEERAHDSRPNKRPLAACASHLVSPTSDLPFQTSHSVSNTTESGAKSKRPRTANRQQRKAEYRNKKKDEGFKRAGQAPRPKVVEQHAKSSTAVPVDFDTSQLPANSSGYEALPQRKTPKEKLVLQELLDDGWTKIEWDGKETKVVQDQTSAQLFAFCVGRVNDPSFDRSCDEAAKLLVQLGRETNFTSKQTDHKRGNDFAAVNTGIFAGHGPPEPYNLLNTKHQDLVDTLLANEHIQRLATFQSSSLALHAPLVYERYHHVLTSVVEHCPKLTPNFTRSVFSTAAFNLGPQVCTVKHIDCMNLANGFCAVHALGDYDYRKGGHLVLVEPRLIIEFPPGCLILLPSAVVTHANTPVQADETRVSFTQYTPGALFRYVDNGFRTLAKFRKEDPAGYEAMMEKRASRWKDGLNLWPTFEELVDYHHGDKQTS
ncbi:hypothetical protein NMY22_g18107 [Coprinellus aureogranulatus]|nr:hypothetical protein NMY22_g18107 [Coprinellus aureogranulatus]